MSDNDEKKNYLFTVRYDGDFETFEEAVTSAKERALDGGQKLSIFKKIAETDSTNLLASIDIKTL